MNDFKLPLLIFDSECTLCTRFKITLEKMDGQKKINYASLHDENLYQAYPQLDRNACHQAVHLIDENNKIHQGPEVIEYLVKYFPGISKISWLIETDMGKKAIDFFYQKVNDIRNSQINSCNKCKTSSKD